MDIIFLANRSTNFKNVITILFFIFVFFIGIASYAEVEDVKVGGEIACYGFFRKDYDFTGSSKDNQDFGSTVTRLSISADLTDNVGCLFLLSNERDWDEETTAAAGTEIRLDLAHITLNELFYSPLTLALGKQELVFGDALIVGASGRNYTTMSASDYSARTAFDALRLTMDYEPVVVDAIYAKISENNNALADDINLYGLNLGYEFLDYNGEAEVYYFAKHDSSAVPSDEVNTLGMRGSFSPIEPLTLSGEAAYQFGDYDAGTTSRDRKAWALDLGADYTFDTNLSPTLNLRYMYLSGEESGDSGDYEAWDSMFEDQINGRIYDFIFAGTNCGCNSNIKMINLGGTIEPVEDISLCLDYYHYWLDEKFAAGAHPMDSSYTVTTDDHLGDAIDLVAEYAYTEDVTIGLEANWFVPGDAFAAANNETGTQVVGSLAVSF